MRKDIVSYDCSWLSETTEETDRRAKLASQGKGNIAGVILKCTHRNCNTRFFSIAQNSEIVGHTLSREAFCQVYRTSVKS